MPNPSCPPCSRTSTRPSACYSTAPRAPRTSSSACAKKSACSGAPRARPPGRSRRSSTSRNARWSFTCKMPPTNSASSTASRPWRAPSPSASSPLNPPDPVSPPQHHLSDLTVMVAAPSLSTYARHGTHFGGNMITSITATRGGEYGLHSATINKMFRFRAEMFCNRLKWPLELTDGLEKDQYDALNPIYLLSRTARNEIESSARLLPTTGRNMLPEVFSQMLQGEAAPASDDVWELSRFAVIPSFGVEQQQAVLHPITLRMMQCAIDFADQNGVCRYVVVTSVALERLLRRIGLSMRRFGRGEAMRIGSVLSVACLIDVNDQTRRAIQDGLATGIHKEAACTSYSSATTAGANGSSPNSRRDTALHTAQTARRPSF